MPQINVNLIRAFEGPIHSRLERIWERIADTYKDYFTLRVFDNLGAPLRHAQALQKIWEEEKDRPEKVAIFTEFDFLPTHGFEWVIDRTCHYSGAVAEASSYVVRDAKSLRHTVLPGTAGAWWILFVKPWLLEHGSDAVRAVGDGLSDGGPFNDPAGNLVRTLQERASISVRLLEAEDCYPDHFGSYVRDRGVHLFWSRHYNDQPYTNVAGFGLAPILRGVKSFVKRYEEALDWCNGALPPKALLAPGDREAVFQTVAGRYCCSLLYGPTDTWGGVRGRAAGHNGPGV